MRDPKDLVMIISGASSGLGRALALGAGAAGASLGLCGRSPERLETLLAELGGSSAAHRVHAEAFDATDAEAVAAFVDNVVERFHKVDVLVNCAGANTARGPVSSLSLADLGAMFDLNCRAAVSFIQSSHPHLEHSGAGLVLNILSSCCHFANEGLGAYTASKAALDGLTKVYRKEARKAGIRVCAVYPGGIDTPFRPQRRPEYLDPRLAAEAVLNLILLDPSIAPDEFTLRPLVETNYP